MNVDPTTDIEGFLRALPEPATWERVEDGFWYVRIPGSARRWIPIELRLGPRTLEATSLYCIPPEENEAEAYRYLLAQNRKATGVAFCTERDRMVSIAGRIPRDEISADSLDAVVGAIVDLTEGTFQGYLRIGFASRFR